MSSPTTSTVPAQSSFPEGDRVGPKPSAWQSFAGATWRNNLRLSRNSASIVSALVIPGMFMLSFWVVFGHAASNAGFDYALFLMAACMFQAAMFAAGGSAMALAVDAESGLLARMRTMPITPVAAIGGRLATDLFRSASSVAVAVAIGLVCGAEPASWTRLVASFLLALLMCEVLSLAFSGLVLRSAQPVQAAGALHGIEVPLLMLSTAFIPVSTLPDWLEPIIRHTPFSPLIDTTRAMLTGTPVGSTGWEALAWLVAGLTLGSWWVSKAFRRQA